MSDYRIAGLERANFKGSLWGACGSLRGEVRPLRLAGKEKGPLFCSDPLSPFKHKRRHMT